MKKLLTTLLCVLLLLSAFGCYTFGENTDFTVTIGKKTFNLDYVNNIDNLPEMKKIVAESNGSFYIEASKCYYYGKMNIQDDKIEVSDKITKLDFSKEKFEGYDNSVENHNNISTKVEQALLGTTMKIQINKGMSGIQKSFYYQVYDNGKAISDKTRLKNSTTIYPSKKIGDSIDIKLFDKKFNEIITITDITITEDYIVEKNISGTITLLEDEQHKNEGTNISVICSELKDTGCSVIKSTNIYIPEGKTSAQYSFQLSRNKNYIIGYKITNKDTNFVPMGYYNKGGLVYEADYADLLNLQDNDINDVNITINPSISIEGRVILPNDFKTPSGGLDIYIKGYIITKDTAAESLKEISKDYIHIEEDKSSCEYKLNVKPNSNYVISYNIKDKKKFPYSSFGYYTVNKVVPSSSEAQKIHITDQNVQNVDIVFNEISFIEGTISIPDNEKTAKRDINITVRAVEIIKEPDGYKHTNWDYHKNQNITIKKGTNSAKYRLYVEKNHTYVVNFSIDNKSTNYIKNTFYKKSKVVYDPFVADNFIIENENINGIDFVLEPGMKINSSIELDKKFILQNNIKYLRCTTWINAYSELYYNGILGNIKIPISKNRASYNFKISSKVTDKYILQFDIYTENNDLIKTFYYGSNGITSELSQTQWFRYDKNLNIKIDYTNQN